MIPSLSLQNLFSWSVQIAMIVVAGIALPNLFRIRHPQMYLAYCYVLLAGCLAIPFLQPLQHPAPAAADGYRLAVLGNSNTSMAALPAVSWNRVIAFVLIAGVLARLGFFLAGLLRLRHYRALAVPLQFPRESILSLCKMLDRKVEIGVSADDVGPVTLGWRHPMILLPDSFMTLEEEAQQAILCHELLHVTRHDWLMNVFEEWIGACFWFHPAIWLLLSQTKLAREQLVDSEVIRLTAAPEPYLAALLAMAGHPGRSWVSAPAFCGGRHLSRRIRLLLMDRSTSTRLACSYVSIFLVLSYLCWTAMAAFPLMGQPRFNGVATFKEQERASPLVASLATSGTHPTASARRVQHDGWQEVVYNVGNGVSAPRVLAKVDPEYSDAARLARLEGTVVVEGIVMTDGSFGSINILRSPDGLELNRSAIRAVRQWKFDPGKLRGQPVPVRLVVEVSFKLK